MTPLQARLKAAAKRCLKPRPRLNVRQWADEYRRLSSESASEPGRWRTGRVPYMAEPMETITNPAVKQMVLMLSSQMGKTEFILNVFGFFADLEPSPVLLIQPTEGFAGDFSKERIAPMIRDTPVLADLFKASKSDSANTIFHKSFPGGFLALGGSNSPTVLAGRPIRVVLLDEVDRFPKSAKNEGDPVSLVSRRVQNFPDSKIIAVSTPTIKGDSKIESLFLDSDQRHWHIKCLHCAEFFYPQWKHVTWTVPEDAAIACPHCGGLHNEHQRLKASQHGKWVAFNPGHRIPGFHTNALVTPLGKPLVDFVYEFLATENRPSNLQPFYNTVLGLPYEFVGADLTDPNSVKLTDYDRTRIPEDVMFLTCGADVQIDRIEYEVVGHTAQGQTYSIDYQVIQGDTKDLATFEEFKHTLLTTKYLREDGVSLEVNRTLIDCAYNSKIVYKFTDNNRIHQIYACRGVDGAKPLITQSTSKFGATFYRVASDIFKEKLFNDLQLTDESKYGYCYFPVGRDKEYFTQLCLSETAERTVDNRGRSYLHFKKKTPDSRNEALDCRIYAMAAFEMIRGNQRDNIMYRLEVQLERLKKGLESEPKYVESSEKEPEVINKTEVLPAVDPYDKWRQRNRTRQTSKWVKDYQ